MEELGSSTFGVSRGKLVVTFSYFPVGSLLSSVIGSLSWIDRPSLLRMLLIQGLTIFLQCPGLHSR